MLSLVNSGKCRTRGHVIAGSIYQLFSYNIQTLMLVTASISRASISIYISVSNNIRGEVFETKARLISFESVTLKHIQFY